MRSACVHLRCMPATDGCMPFPERSPGETHAQRNRRFRKRERRASLQAAADVQTRNLPVRSRASCSLDHGAVIECLGLEPRTPAVRGRCAAVAPALCPPTATANSRSARRARRSRSSRGESNPCRQFGRLVPRATRPLERLLVQAVRRARSRASARNLPWYLIRHVSHPRPPSQRGGCNPSYRSASRHFCITTSLRLRHTERVRLELTRPWGPTVFGTVSSSSRIRSGSGGVDSTRSQTERLASGTIGRSYRCGQWATAASGATFPRSAT